MDYDKILLKNGNAVITGLKCFSLPLILDCGQAFRWRENEDGSFSGVALGHELRLKQENDTLIFYNTSTDEVEKIWLDYFDLHRDYQKICTALCRDEKLNIACTKYPGIRILKQDEWETLCSFIISQNNNIPRIKGIIERLCESFGDRLETGGYTFPCAETLAVLEPDDLAPLRAGFRNKYIIDAARKVSSGEVDINKLKVSSPDEIREALLKIKGVGAKVAECTLLFGFGDVDAFPVDVWVRRIMSELYPDGLPECTNAVRGIAQQYLFHWRRNLEEGTNKNAG